MFSSRFFEPLRHRDFALLWSGQAISQLGDGVFTVTVALEALRVDRHAIGLSYVLAARLLPAVLFTLFGGVIVDRVPRRFAMLASDLAQGVAVTAIAVLVAVGHIDLLGLVLMALVFGFGDAVFFPAAMAITPEIVPSQLLVSASALTNTSIQLGRVLIGPAIGGVLFGVLGGAWGFGLDAASFAISAATLIAMTASGKSGAASEASPLQGIREGLRYLFSERWLWVTSLAAALGNFVAFSPLGVMTAPTQSQTSSSSARFRGRRGGVGREAWYSSV